MKPALETRNTLSLDAVVPNAACQGQIRETVDEAVNSSYFASEIAPGTGAFGLAFARRAPGAPAGR